MWKSQNALVGKRGLAQSHPWWIESTAVKKPTDPEKDHIFLVEADPEKNHIFLVEANPQM